MSDETQKSRVICVEIFGDDEVLLESTAEGLRSEIEKTAKAFSLPKGIEMEEIDIVDPDDEEAAETEGTGGDGV